MMPNDSRNEAPALDRRRYPHVWSWCSSILGNWSMHSLGIKLLGLLVEWSALLDDCEALDLQFLAGLLACCNPRGLLACEGLLLADDLARLVLHEITFGHARCSLAHLAGKEVTPCEP